MILTIQFHNSIFKPTLSLAGRLALEIMSIHTSGTLTSAAAGNIHSSAARIDQTKAGLDFVTILMRIFKDFFCVSGHLIPGSFVLRVMSAVLK